MPPEYQEVLDEARADPDTPVFFLGCFERRVTFYAQQVRALNLADALLASGIVRADGRVAVVGGGIAGLTCAAALGTAAPQLQVTVFEQHDKPLNLQLGARDRFIHPHIFDWPASESHGDRAGLPIMDWQAAPADQVVTHMYEEFLRVVPATVQVRTRVKVEEVKPLLDYARVLTRSPEDSVRYDAVVLAIGFGEERLRAVKENLSYWAASPFVGPIHSTKPRVNILVSGNGDGALTDFVSAAFNGDTHRRILDRVTQSAGLDEVKRILLDIEDKAWADPAFDIVDAYRRNVAPSLPSNLVKDICDHQRDNIDIVLHCREERLFKRESALLNRFVAFLVLHVDEKYKLGRVKVILKRKIAYDPASGGEVQIEGDAPYRPDMLLLRFGPDSDTNLAPFADWLRKYNDLHPDFGRARTRTPKLTSGAAARWNNVPAPAAPATAAPDLPAAPAAPRRASVQTNVVEGDVAQNAVVNQIYIGR